MSRLLRDFDVRRAAHGRLLHHARRCPDTLVIDELGLDHGACRIDIAVINGHIRGLEIKADADNLGRLPRQAQIYGAVVDKASLIVAARHLDEAVRMVPEWWGVIVTEGRGSGGVIFNRVREERVNRHTDSMMVARLLWRPEVVALLRGLGHPARMLRAPREALYGLLVAELSPRQLAATVREALKHRAAWRDRAQPW